jgi:solute carrier family 9 (sodium/hydrogen exchanger), member 3
VIGLFRRESSCSGSGSPQLDSELQMTGIPAPVGRASADRRSASIAGGMISDENGHSGIFPVTASHRRNTRRGSMLEITG